MLDFLVADLYRIKSYRGFIIAGIRGCNDAFFAFLPNDWINRLLGFYPVCEGGSVKECEQVIDSY